MSFGAGEGLHGMTDIAEVLDRHTPPAAVALVAEGDEVRVATRGEATRDSIFRIASISKPITAAALLMLVDDGLVGLDDPIGRFVPELAEPKVLRAPDAALDDLVSLAREVTVRDVLESRAGWGFPSDFSLPAVELYFQRAFAFGRPFDGVDDWVAGLARVPLLAQPGELWLYNACSDLQGALIERASGLPLAAFLQDRVFGPLGMADTAFFTPPGKRSRRPPYVSADLSPIDPALDCYDEPPGFASGAGGLVSTANDWLAFGRMLLADGVPLLRAESVRLLTTNHLTDEQRAASTLFLEGDGWGYGGSVRSETGRYGWVGGTGTTAHVLPSANRVAILLTQVQMGGPTPTPLMRDFWKAAGV
jgi:CubicO group peptidase (beta-lactamase class C family)